MTSSFRNPYTAGTPTSLTFEPFPTSIDDDSLIPPHASLASKTETHVTRLRGIWRNAVDSVRTTVEGNAGMLLVAASQCFLSLVNVIVKYLSSLDPPVPALELIWARMAITWICCVTYMLYMNVPDPFWGPKEVRWLLVSRGFFGFVGISGVYYSLQYLSLSDATVLQFLAPITTIIVAAVLLGETFSWKHLLAGLCSLIGVVLIARPQFLFGHDTTQDGDASIRAEGEGEGLGVTSAQRLAAVGAALISVVGATGAYTSIRAIGKRAHTLHNLVSYSTQSVIVSTIAMIVLRVPVVIPTRLDWLALLLAIGLLGFVAQSLLTAGLQRETAGRGTMAVYAQMIFAVIFERIFFHTIPTPLSLIGTVIILASAICVALSKEVTSAKKRGTGVLPSTAEDISLEERLLDNREDALDEELKHSPSASED
ncbi:hypothetical protein NM688_g5551 [Phlebia brevispora]|uniref:Uncharacterized protein n=1 Tax=Phlebia brevispora TaxID=194682 RepID=A0ACC1STK8_9APHY|nr:hypothetical protein NM688_g5551 [Phlebia brevispora]